MTTGVKGNVLKLTGDFMPMCGPDRPGRNSITPHQNVTVIAFRAPVFPAEVKSYSSSLESIKTHPQFIQMTQTNSEGKYQLDLPASLEVAIVAWIENGPYLNLYVVSGSWFSITVPDSGYITFDIEDSMGACW